MRIAAILLLAASLFAAGSEVFTPQVPRPAGNFAVQTGPDKYIWLSEYSGKTVILAFILTDCTHCQFTTGLLNKIQHDFADRGVQVLASAIDSMSALKLPDFQKKFQPVFPLGYNDLKYATTFLGYAENDPMFAPQLVFIDRTGVIRAQFGGDNPALDKAIQDATLRAALDMTLREGRPPTPAAAPAKKQ